MFSKESRSEKLERLTERFLDDYGDEGLEEIIDNLKTPWNLGYSEDLVNINAKVGLPVVDGPSFPIIMKKIYAMIIKNFFSMLMESDLEELQIILYLMIYRVGGQLLVYL